MGIGAFEQNQKMNNHIEVDEYDLEFKMVYIKQILKYKQQKCNLATCLGTIQT